MVVFQRVLV